MATEKKAPEMAPQFTIQNCNFAAVQWDKAALETVQTVAKALLNLSELFRSQNVTVETMMKLDGAGAHIGESTTRAK